MAVADPAPPEALPALRVLIAGGGTGGHLFPGIALAEEVRSHGGEVLFVGTERGIEARVLPEQGWPLELVPVRGIKGRGVAGLFSGLAALPRAYFASRRILESFRPDVVVGVGGYASGPVVATAALQRRPTAILEQNSVPGITNRILGRVVGQVYCTFEDRLGRFPARKIAMTGNPIRRSIVEQLSGAARDVGRTDTGGPRLFVFGGSQGARAINEAMMGAAAGLRESVPGLRIHHQTGQADEERVREAYVAAGWGEDVTVSAFIRDMAAVYAWCDLVVCRAGATSLSELAVAGKPAVLIPFPHATDDHQTGNARSLVDAGAAELLPQTDLSPQVLTDRVRTLAGDPAVLSSMTRAMRGAARPDAAAHIYRSLVKLAGR